MARRAVEMIDVLRGASARVYERVAGMAGTPAAVEGDHGVGAGGDVSRNIDVTAERAVLEHLAEAGVSCTVLGEECGRVVVGGGDPSGYVIMDAVDGSANAVRGVPFFCCSLAYARDYTLGSVTDAVVANLATGQAYTAAKGRGAFLDGRPVSVQSRPPVYRILGANTSGASHALVERLRPLFAAYGHVRHFGANALEMSMLAAGLMDVFIDLRGKIRVQDAAAGCLIVREAGGLVVDESLSDLDSDLDYATRLSFIAASSRRVLDETVAEMGPPA